MESDVTSELWFIGFAFQGVKPNHNINN